jgi:hypothetical protein
MTKSERLASTGKSFEAGSNSSESDDSDTEDGSTSDQSSSLDITDEEGQRNDVIEDSSDDDGKSQESMDFEYRKDKLLTSTFRNDTGLKHHLPSIDESERHKLDSGIGSSISSSMGSLSNTADIRMKRKRLVSIPSGSLEDNVFTNSDK